MRKSNEPHSLIDLVRADVFLPLQLEANEGGQQTAQRPQPGAGVLQGAEGDEEVAEIPPEVQPDRVHLQQDLVGQVMPGHGVHEESGVVQLGLKVVQLEEVKRGGGSQSNQPSP